MKRKNNVQGSKNPNHPREGACLVVEPFRSTEDLSALKKVLSNRPRDLALLTLAINSGIRTADLLRLKIAQVRHLKVNETLTIIEKKTKKPNTILFNEAIYKALQSYLNQAGLTDGDYLFKSRKGDGPLSMGQLNRMIKEWAASIGLKGRYGARSLRKTFGYIQRVVFHVPIEILTKRFNHSSTRETMRYLGLQDVEVNSILKNQI